MASFLGYLVLTTFEHTIPWAAPLAEQHHVSPPRDQTYIPRTVPQMEGQPAVIYNDVVGDELALCAALMMTTPPWTTLNFTIDSCLAALLEPRVEVVGAYQENLLVGFVAMLAQGIEFDPIIVFLAVSTTFQGRGLGTALVAYFEDRFADAANLYMFVSDINPGAQRLYQRLGYLPVGAFPDFNLVGQTEFLYRKTRRPFNSP
jgi:ribosomal protein S18 acetylase RimI-like enzyme